MSLWVACEKISGMCESTLQQCGTDNHLDSKGKTEVLIFIQEYDEVLWGMHIILHLLKCIFHVLPTERNAGAFPYEKPYPSTDCQVPSFSNLGKVLAITSLAEFNFI